MPDLPVLPDLDASSLRYPSLLAVDDDQVSLIALEAALEGFFRVSSELSGALAVRRAAEQTPDAILLDVRMPNIDGFDVLRQLRSHPVTQGIPVICMSADASEESRMRAYALGASGYLVKPLDLSRITDDIAAILEASRGARLASADGSRRIVVARNRVERINTLRSEVLAELEDGRGVVCISPLEGRLICDARLEDEIANGSLVVLQAKPSLYIKIPYLVDLSPLVEELDLFLPSSFVERSREIALIWDDPRLLLDARGAHAAAGPFRVAEAVTRSGIARSIVFIAVQGGSQAEQTMVMEMASALCG